MATVKGWVGRLATLPPSRSAGQARQARILVALATGMLVVAGPVAVFVLVALPQPQVNVLLVAAGLPVYVFVRHEVARSRLEAATWAMLGYFLAVPLLGAAALGQTQASPFVVLVVVVLAGALLPPPQVVVAAMLCLLDLLLIPALAGPTPPLPVDHVLVYLTLTLVLVSSAAAVTSQAIRSAFAETDGSRQRAERLASDLREANTRLEARVAERTRELQSALARQEDLASRLAELSVRDALTGLHNRRHLDEALARLFEAAVVRGEPLCVAVADLDDFKGVNDRFTHVVGDDVLRSAAALFSSGTRASDVLVRMGGEEFALLMPATTALDAVRVCERIRAEIAAFDWAGVRPGLSVTASFGIACSTDHGSAADLVRAADERLYRAKRRGKNRIEVWSPS